MIKKIYVIIIQPLLVGFLFVYLLSDKTYYPQFLKDFSMFMAILIIAVVTSILTWLIVGLAVWFENKKK